MSAIKNAVEAEFIKFKSSGVFYATMIFFVFIPFMIGLVVLLSQHPELLEKLGIIGTKAEMLSANNWEGYLELLNQMNAIISMIGFGFIFTWIYGSEHLNKTFTSIITLPVKRNTIVSAKLITAFCWCGIVALLHFASGIVFGFIFQVPQWSPEAFGQFRITFFLVALLTFVVTTPIAFITNWSRGIFAPIAFILICLIMAQLTVVMGLGSLFPWAVPGILSVRLSQPGMVLNTTSYLLVGITGIVGWLLTNRWWLKSDHH